MIGDYLGLSVKNIRNRKLRAWLTMLGIVIGVATIIALISIGQGMQNAIEEQFSKLGANQIRVIPANLRGPPSGEKGITKDDAKFLETIMGVDYVSPVLMQFASVEYANQEMFLSIIGYETDSANKQFADLDVAPEVGRFFKQGDKYVAIVGHKVAYDIFDDDVRVRTSFTIKEQKFKIIGIFEETGVDTFDNNVIIPMETARDLFNRPDVVNMAVVALKPGVDKDDMVETIKRKLERKRGNDDFDVITPEQLLSQINSILGVIQVVLGGIAAISLLVGGIGILNSMYTSVLERTRDIGVMKAVGAKNRDILSIFLLESGLMAIVGGFIGVVIGIFVAKMVEVGARLSGFTLLAIKIDPMIILFGLLVALIIGLASGVFPAMRAAKLRPVDSLRYE